MKIAEHCQKGNWHSFDYIPFCAWGEDVYVQWGKNGFVISRSTNKVNSVSAFFEAFPPKPNDVFIRGEGETLSDAENNAFAQYNKFIKCPEHEWERRGREDGFGYCKKCGIGKGDVLPSLFKCIVCGDPTHWTFKKVNGVKIFHCHLHDPKLIRLSDDEFHLKIQAAVKYGAEVIMETRCKDYEIQHMLVLSHTKNADGTAKEEYENVMFWYKNGIVEFATCQKGPDTDEKGFLSVLFS